MTDQLLWQDYSFIVRGKQRRTVFAVLSVPKTPTQIASETKVRLTHVSRVLKQFEKRGLVKCLAPNEKFGRPYVLTESGKAVRLKLMESISTA